MNGRSPRTLRLKRLGGIRAGCRSPTEPSDQRKMRVTEDVLASGSESHAEAFPSFAGTCPVLRNLPPPKPSVSWKAFIFNSFFLMLSQNRPSYNFCPSCVIWSYSNSFSICPFRSLKRPSRPHFLLAIQTLMLSDLSHPPGGLQIPQQP